MKFTCNTTELTNALGAAGRALSPRAILRTYDDILLTAHDSSLTVTASDGTLRMTATIYASVDEPGALALDGKLLCECVRRMNGAETTIEQSASTAVIRSGKCKTQMAVHDPDDYPAAPHGKTPSVTVTVPAPALKSCIDYVKFAAATDESRKILTGILMEIADGKLLAVGLDGFRLAKKETTVDYSGPALRVVLPHPGAMELSRLASNADSLSIDLDDAFLTARVDAICLTMPTLTGEYIDYKRIIPQNSPHRAKVRADELKSCCERAQLMAKQGKNNLIRMDFQPNHIALTSNADVGTVYDEAECELQGDGIKIAFNCAFFLEALKVETTNEIEIAMSTPVGAAAIRRICDPGTLQLVLPVREFQ